MLAITMKAFSAIRGAAIDGRLQNPFFRKEQLKKLHNGLVNSATEIQAAILEDSGHSPAEVKVEYWLALKRVEQDYDAIDPEAVLSAEYSIAKNEDAPKAHDPVGIVLIEPATHAFLFSLMSALSPAIAAGNCVIVKVRRRGSLCPDIPLLDPTNTHGTTDRANHVEDSEACPRSLRARFRQ